MHCSSLSNEKKGLYLKGLVQFVFIWQGVSLTSWWYWQYTMDCKRAFTVSQIEGLLHPVMNEKPEDHWSCVAYLSAEEKFKIIESEWFGPSPWPLVLIKLHVHIKLTAPTNTNFYITNYNSFWKIHCFNFFPYKRIGDQMIGRVFIEEKKFKNIESERFGPRSVNDLDLWYSCRCMYSFS